MKNMRAHESLRKRLIKVVWCYTVVIAHMKTRKHAKRHIWTYMHMCV